MISEETGPIHGSLAAARRERRLPTLLRSAEPFRPRTARTASVRHLVAKPDALRVTEQHHVFPHRANPCAVRTLQRRTPPQSRSQLFQASRWFQTPNNNTPPLCSLIPIIRAPLIRLPTRYRCTTLLLLSPNPLTIPNIVLACFSFLIHENHSMSQVRSWKCHDIVAPVSGPARPEPQSHRLHSGRGDCARFKQHRHEASELQTPLSSPTAGPGKPC